MNVEHIDHIGIAVQDIGRASLYGDSRPQDRRHRRCGRPEGLFFNDMVITDEIEKEWLDFDFEERMAGRAVGWVERSLGAKGIAFVASYEQLGRRKETPGQGETHLP